MLDIIFGVLWPQHAATSAAIQAGTAKSCAHKGPVAPGQPVPGCAGWVGGADGVPQPADLDVFWGLEDVLPDISSILPDVADVANAARDVGSTVRTVAVVGGVIAGAAILTAVLTNARKP